MFFETGQDQNLFDGHFNTISVRDLHIINYTVQYLEGDLFPIVGLFFMSHLEIIHLFFLSTNGDRLRRTQLNIACLSRLQFSGQLRNIHPHSTWNLK